MPSSTSNSRFPALRAPALKWLTVWGLTLAMTAVAIGAAEISWRTRGHRPSMVDSPLYWSYHRSLVGNDSREVVLLGNSRMPVSYTHLTLPTTPYV